MQMGCGWYDPYRITIVFPLMCCVSRAQFVTIYHQVGLFRSWKDAEAIEGKGSFGHWMRSIHKHWRTRRLRLQVPQGLRLVGKMAKGERRTREFWNLP